MAYNSWYVLCTFYSLLNFSLSLTVNCEHCVSAPVEFYITQNQAANSTMHVVREAACICIAELGTKVGQIYCIEPFSAYLYWVVWNFNLLEFSSLVVEVWHASNPDLQSIQIYPLTYTYMYVYQVDKDCLRSHVSQLVTVLLECF